MQLKPVLRYGDASRPQANPSVEHDIHSGCGVGMKVTVMHYQKQSWWAIASHVQLHHKD